MVGGWWLVDKLKSDSLSTINHQREQRKNVQKIGRIYKTKTKAIAILGSKST